MCIHFIHKPLLDVNSLRQFQPETKWTHWCTAANPSGTSHSGRFLFFFFKKQFSCQPRIKKEFFLVIVTQLDSFQPPSVPSLLLEVTLCSSWSWCEIRLSFITNCSKTRLKLQVFCLHYLTFTFAEHLSELIWGSDFCLQGFLFNKIVTELQGNLRIPKTDIFGRSRAEDTLPKTDWMLPSRVSDFVSRFKELLPPEVKCLNHFKGILWVFNSLSTRVPRDDEMLRHLCVLHHCCLSHTTSAPELCRCLPVQQCLCLAALK